MGARHPYYLLICFAWFHDPFAYKRAPERRQIASGFPGWLRNVSACRQGGEVCHFAVKDSPEGMCKGNANVSRAEVCYVLELERVVGVGW